MGWLRDLRCKLFGHRAWFIEVRRSDSVIVCSCGYCGEYLTGWKPIVRAWVEIQNTTPLKAFTITFADPEDVPRAQRISGSMCFPLLDGFEYVFESYKGFSLADKRAIQESK